MAITVYNQSLATGGRDTLDLHASQRVIDMKDKILLLEPNVSPLVTLMARLRSKPAFSPKVEWLEDIFVPKNTLTTAASSAADTDFDVTAGEGSYFKVGDLVKVVRTGEVVRVTATTANTITVTRAFAGAAAALHVSSVADELICVGHASAENAGAPAMVLSKVTPVFNYTQIFRTPLGASRTVEQSKLYGSPDRKYLRYKSALEHKIDMERACFFGKKVENTSIVSGRPLRSMGGLEEFVTTNITSLNSSGLDSLTDLEDFLRTGMRYGSDTKFLFASPLTIQKINELALGKLQVYEGEETLGLSIMKYVSGHGTVNLVKSKLFEGPQTTGMAFLVDLENLIWRPMQSTILKTDIQAPDVDGWADEYLTEASMEVTLEKTHAILKNVDGSIF